MGKEIMKVSVMGLAWFRREDYRTLKSLFADGTGLHPSYDDWLKAAEGMFEQLKRQGIETHKVYIDPEEFPAWCKANGLNIDSKARIRFANETVAKMYLDRNR
jgi:hypothetical protein